MVLMAASRALAFGPNSRPFGVSWFSAWALSRSARIRSPSELSVAERDPCRDTFSVKTGVK